MKSNLDIKDRKILALLDENARYSNSQIAKKVRLSKPAVEYRLNRFKDNNVIFAHYAVIDFTKLGYFQYKLYFKFQNTNLEEENEMINYWNQSKNSIWVGQIRGRCDLAISILAKNNFEFGKILTAFLHLYSKFILEKHVLLTEYSPIYAREYLTDAKPSEFTYGIPKDLIVLDDTDKKILKGLSTSARISIVDLANNLKLSRDIINYRLKKLTNDKVIVQYRTQPNLENLGINLYKLILTTKNFNAEQEKKLKAYVAMHKKATQLLKLIGSWDIEIEIEVESEDELYEILTDIRKEFSSIIRDFDILRITKTFKYDYFPF
jgi:Lrp/AsnC family transcriptional regulator